MLTSTEQTPSQAAAPLSSVPNSDLRESRITKDIMFLELWSDTGFFTDTIT